MRAARLAPGVPVVLMSANSPAGEKTRQLAIDDHLAKPFDLDRLVAVALRYLPPSAG
jgi:CheY-like chemotaxis protein